MADKRPDGTDNRTAYFPEFVSSISFKTQTDALLASFVLEHDCVPMHAIDKFLSLLRAPSFHIDEISFSKAEDIYSHVAEARRTISQERLHRVVSADESTSQNKVPEFVLDEVAEILAAERKPISASFTRTGHGSPGIDISQTSLTNMTLVHRSWTNAAQRVLRRHLSIVGRKNLTLALQSPHVGASVREVFYRSPIASSWMLDYKDDNDNVRELSESLVTLLHRCPNIQHFYMKSCFRSSEHDVLPMITFFDSLCSLQSLEILVLSHQSRGADDLWGGAPVLGDFLQVLPRFRRLRCVSMTGYFAPRPEESDRPLNLYFLESPPPSSLTSLQLSPLGAINAPEVATWLYQPRGNYKLDSIILRISDLFKLGWEEEWHPQPLLSAVLPALPFIKRLRLRSVPVDIEHMDFLEHCRVLTHFSLILSDGEIAVRMRLPPLTKELHIHYWEAPRRWLDSDDGLIHDMLYYAPSIEHVKVTVGGDPPSRRVIVLDDVDDADKTDGPFVVQLPKTQALCVERGYNFNAKFEDLLPFL